jgi:hypothetical protein
MLQKVFLSGPIYFFNFLLLSHISNAEVDFTNDVRPILSEYCFHCHGPDKSTRKAKLRLDLSEGALRDLGGYSAVVPGNPEDSELVFRLHSDDKDELMPPPETGKRLSEKQKKILEEWIKQGAIYEEHWSFLPIDTPSVPTQSTKTKSNHPVDRFLAKKLESEAYSFAKPTEKKTLLRRLYFDLLGMPPTLAEANQFLNDKSDNAYDRLVDGLLADQRFGERMAVHWLDLVRYSDTIGYHSDNFMEVSAYRDYVIDAFNQNMSYDQFVIENLAGDLIPESSKRQKIASGYNRLLQTTQEGGAQAAEYTAIYQADRVRNFGVVWLGATTGCAQCHDHKFDPFTIKDFYSLAAFFADLQEKPVGRRNPNLYLPSKEQEAKLSELELSKKESERRRNLQQPKIQQEEKEFAKELKGILANFLYSEPNKDEVQKKQRIFVEDSAPSDADLNGEWKLTETPVFSGSKSIIRTGKGNNQHYFINSKNPHHIFSEEDEFFAYVYLDPKNPPKQIMLQFNDGSWSRRAYWGESLIPYGKENTTSRIKVGPLPELKKWVRLSVTAKKLGLKTKDKINGIAFTQWDGTLYWDKVGVNTKIDPRQDPDLSLKKWISLARNDNSLPANIQTLSKKEEKDRSEKEIQSLSEYFLNFVYKKIPERAVELRKKLKDSKSEIETFDVAVKKATDAINNYKKTFRSMLVSQTGNKRMVRILPRGNWLDQSGEIVVPAIPEFMGKLDTKDRKANRLDLANWVVSDENPLPARAFTNRIWKMFFGYGLSRRLEDLGGQGEPPTHPKLLDHLASEFRSSGWDMKKLIRTLVTSDAYKQSSVPTEKLAKSDPLNRLYARQSRYRVDAEFVRDTALSISGLLVSDIGGTSVKPYQPAGYWQHLNFPARKWQAGKGDDLYRRGLYTFHCRSFTHPAMLAFDAPSREECTAERPRSNIPQQALALLNDPVFVEAARVFAEKLLTHSKKEDLAKIHYAFQCALTRKPTKEEVQVMTELLFQQRKRYQEDEEAALALVKTGQKTYNKNLRISELAAWTSVSRTLLNMYETTARF